MLHHQLVGDGAARWLAIAHGLFGRGGNWRGFASKLVARCPGWGAVLIDLRMHGRSRDLAPPHDLSAASADIVLLIDSLRESGVEIAGLLGHSFGGKVMMAARPRVANLAVSWIIDASPSARPGSLESVSPGVGGVLRLLEELPPRFDDREAFVADLVGRGLGESVARFLALNLAPLPAGGFRLDLELGALRDLLTDYFARDLWDELESGSGALHVAIAGRDSSLDEGDLERLAELEARGVLHCHRFPDAGHWIHVDAPGPLLDAVAGSLE
jgi:pimeloyl-ACP methyl ester carboxylesterase